MRRSGLVFLVALSAAATAASAAQDEGPRTVDDYVCAFAGECADEPADDEAAPPARGPRVTATRGFSLSTPAAARPPRRAGSTNAARAGRIAVRRPAGPGQRVNLRLSFELGSARLTPAAEAEARVFAQSLQMPQLLTMRFRIEGHTDSSGSRAGNIALSQRRAQSVADFLVSLGVARDRLDVEGYGPDRPLPGTRPAARENRRVEAVRVS